ncbi:hypothetical protein PTTG_02889 [Puccinia triticina 1-1 BBBD Race 1]|uniref:Glutathione S-transferase kappa n=1 Tax=Puccinia triticina (isolate 1-1 / race 1 (BBBD)) TaxID=630390 RepID=A0A180H3N8_PUCT1|nr:hypothetical protein PTTG_02889 [Puccinia triticina 1-1 BBBD Race 1]
MSKRLTIRLSYDIVSPWSYFAYVVLKRYRPIWDFDLILNPVYLGGVMKGSKNTPPFAAPNKLKKMNEEIPLMSKFLGVKCAVPRGPFPFNTLPIMRFLKVVQEKAPDRLEASTDKLYEVVFENKVEVSDNIAGVLGSLSPAPFEASALEEYVRLSSSTETKERVKQDAERLVAEGAFGFPWLEVCKPDGQRLTIFGSDRFEFLADWLGQEWKGPNPSVVPPKSRL